MNTYFVVRDTENYILKADSTERPGTFILSEELAAEEAEWLEVVDNEVVINQQVKDAVLAERELLAGLEVLRKEKEQLLQLLLNSDWMLIRKTETGVEVPEEVLAERQAARDRISEIREVLGE